VIDRLIFFPKKSISGYSEPWKSSEFILNVNQQLLHGWFVKAEFVEKSPLIIYYGGNAEDVSINLSYLQPAEPQATSWLLMNYRGFGKSTGKPSQAGVFADALAVYDHLIKNTGISPEKIFLMGRSIGSSVAAYVASQRKVGGLILVTPFDSIVNFAPKFFKIFPIKRYLEKYFNTQKYLEGVQGKILVIAAGRDEVVPKINLENLINQFKDQLEVVEIKKANHQNIADFHEFESAVNEYIHRLPSKL
jgi:hypothetical protein